MATTHKSCVLVTDLGGVIRFATFSACRLFGLSDYEATDMHFDDVAEQIHADLDWEELVGDPAACETVVERETAFTSPVGYRGRLSLQAHAVCNLEDEPTSYVVLLDILPRTAKTQPGRESHAFAGKYATTSLTYERGRELFLRMDKLVREEELFRGSRLSVSSLAQHLNTNTQYLSHVVNYFCGERFPSYINRLRVQWMNTELAKSSKRRKTGMWREAGFGSYSAYHRALKQLKQHASAEAAAAGGDERG